MPSLILKIVPTADGEQTIVIDRDLQAQEFVLRKTVIIKPNLNYAQDCFQVNIPFLSGFEIHTNSKRAFFPVCDDPTQRVISTNYDLKFGSENIPNQFNILLHDDNNTPITTTTDLTAIYLYFDYTTNSLF